MLEESCHLNLPPTRLQWGRMTATGGEDARGIGGGSPRDKEGQDAAAAK